MTTVKQKNKRMNTLALPFFHLPLLLHEFPFCPEIRPPLPETCPGLQNLSLPQLQENTAAFIYCIVTHSDVRAHKRMAYGPL